MEPALAKEAYRASLRSEKNAYQVRKVQEKIAALSDEPESGDVATSGGEPMDDLLDPLLSFRMEAKQHEKNAADNPVLALHSYVQAATSWIKAEEADRAAAALKKASDALRRKRGSSKEHEHSNLAKLYQQIGRNQEAVNHFAEALKHCKSKHSIEQYQSSIEFLMDEDAAVKVAPDAEALIDPNYKFRAEARSVEKLQTNDARTSASFLVKAAGLWGQAGDKDEVTRVGLEAESAISRMKPSTSYSPQERICVDLAEAYQSVNLHEAAVRSYVSAIGYATRDDDAVKYHEQIKQICDKNGISIPSLDPKSAVKLDPLNRHRVKALEQEQRAEKERNLSSKMRYWMSASESWLKAKENQKALNAADRYAAMLIKQGRAREYELGKLAELYMAIGNKERAISALNKAISMTKSDYHKQKFEDQINALR